MTGDDPRGGGASRASRGAPTVGGPAHPPWVAGAVFARAPVGLAVLDRTMRFVCVNDALARMNGLPPGAHVGRTPAEILPGLPEEQYAPPIRRVLRTGRPVLGVEVTGSTPASPSRPRHWTEDFFPVPDADGRVNLVGIVVVEDTLRVEAERRSLAQSVLGEALLAARTPEDVSEAVLEAVERVVGPSWSGVVAVLDPGRDRELRLTAHRNVPVVLVERATWVPLVAALPLTEAVRRGETVVVSGRDEVRVRYPDLSRYIPAESTSIVSVPLPGEEGVGGGFGVGLPAGREPSGREVEVLEALASQAGQALRRIRLYESDRRARRRTERMDLLSRALATAATIDDVASEIAEKAAAVFGASTANLALVSADGTTLTIRHSSHLDEGIARRWPSVANDGSSPLSRAVRTGEPVVIEGPEEMAREFPSGFEDARVAGLVALAATPLHGAEGPLGALGLAWDRLERMDEATRSGMLVVADLASQALQRAELFDLAHSLRDDEERKRRRAEFLSEISARLDAVQGVRARADELVALLVPRVADFASLDVAVGDGTRHVAVGHRDPALGRRVELLRQAIEHAPAGRPLVPGGLASRLYGGPDELTDAAWPLSPDARRLLGEVPLASIAVLRLDADGVEDATLVVGLAPGARRPYAERDLVFLESVARRVTLAIQNARLFERERRIAVDLQRSLLAGDLPSPFGARVRVHHSAGDDELEVGGDWFDVQELPGGRVALLVGDVVGRGLSAATAMGQLRSASRALVLEDLGPAKTLERFDEFAANVPGGRMTTALLVEADPAGGAVRYSCAGHPPPVALASDGHARLLMDGRATPLGIGRVGVRPEGSARLEAGSRLLLYTDGLVERRRESIFDGLERVRAAAERHAGLDQDAFCDALIGDLTRGRSADDDRVLMCLEVLAPSPSQFAARVPARPSDVASARAAMGAWLVDTGIRGALSRAVAAGVGEALALVADRGVHPPVDLDVDVEVEVGRLVARIREIAPSSGERRPSVLEGATAAMRAFADDVRVERGRPGTTMTLEWRRPSDGGGPTRDGGGGR